MVYLSAYVLEVLVLLKIEKFCWGTYFTPLNCLAVPSGIIMLLAVVISYSSSSYTPFFLPSLQVWIIGLLLFALPSWIFSRGKKEITTLTPLKKDYTSINIKKNEKLYRFFCKLTFLLIAIAFIRMRRSMGNASWGSDEFSENYTSGGGIVSHLNVLLAVIFIYMMYMGDRKHTTAWVICVLIIINMFAVGVKSWIIGPCLIGYLGRVMTKRSSINLWTILLLGFLMIFIFASSYFLLMVVTERSEMSNEFLSFLINHFTGYLIGPVLSFSVDFQLGIQEPYMPEALFAPIVNFCKIFTGETYILPINPVWVSYGIGQGNVRTFFGTIFCYSRGEMAFVIVLLMYSLYFYMIRLLSITCRNPMIKLADCVNMGFLILGFFEFYWLNLAPFEMVLFFLIMGFFFSYLGINNESVSQANN